MNKAVCFSAIATHRWCYKYTILCITPTKCELFRVGGHVLPLDQCHPAVVVFGQSRVAGAHPASAIGVYDIPYGFDNRHMRVAADQSVHLIFPDGPVDRLFEVVEEVERLLAVFSEEFCQ